jgi:hypothetical protein
MGTNSQLKLRACDIIEKAKNEYEQKLEPVIELMDSCFSKDKDLEEVRKLFPNLTWDRSLCCQTEKSWSRQRESCLMGLLIIYSYPMTKRNCSHCH